MNKISEKELDKAIETQFQKDSEFAAWFLSNTKFKSHKGHYIWSRSNHPWGRVHLPVQSPHTNEVEEVVKEGETDVLVVFESEDRHKFAIHIENKITGGKFIPYQPEQYGPRAEKWKGNPKYGGYQDYETVLIAPNSFYGRNKESSNLFDVFISHEEIAHYIPLFKPS